MTTRRSFFKRLAGAVLAVTMGKQLGAIVPEAAVEEAVAPISLEGFKWAYDPYPMRFVMNALGEWEQFVPFIERDSSKGKYCCVNPEWANATHELRLGYKGYMGDKDAEFIQVMFERDLENAITLPLSCE